MTSIVAGTCRAAQMRQLHRSLISRNESAILAAGVPAAAVGFFADWAAGKALDEFLEFLKTPSRADRIIAKELFQAALEKCSREPLNRSLAINVCHISATITKSYGASVISDALREGDYGSISATQCRTDAVVGIDVSIHPEEQIRPVCEAKAEIGVLEFDTGAPDPEPSHPFHDDNRHFRDI